jgi:hypothetical protein
MNLDNMKRDEKLEKAANKILDAFEKHLARFPPEERKARWNKFQRSAASLDNRAKPGERPKTLHAPH